MKFRQHSISTQATSALLALAAAPVWAATTQFDDRDLFLAAVAGQTLVADSFDTPIAGAVKISFDSGVVSQNNLPPFFANDNAVLEHELWGGHYQNSLSTAFDEIASINLWTFPTAVTAFGFDSWTGSFNGVRVFIGSGESGQSFGLFPEDVGSSITPSFYGFVLDAPLTSISFFNPNPISNDTYRIDDLVFATGPAVAPVPLPASLPFLVVGLGALAALTRRRGTRPVAK